MEKVFNNLFSVDNGNSNKNEEPVDKSPVSVIGGEMGGVTPQGGGASGKTKGKRRKAEGKEGKVLYDKDKVCRDIFRL